MKKIAFFVQHMLCGGVENSLIALTKELQSLGNEVTIYVISETGEFMNRIPDGVIYKKIPLPQNIENVLPIGGTKISIRKNISQHHYIRAAINLKNHIFSKSGFAELNVDFDSIPVLAEKYDIAVNFHIHSPFLVRYLSEKVKAKKKISWIHNDFTTTAYNIKRLQCYMDCCEAFYAVSKRLLQEFVDIFPEYKEKSSVIYNLVPVDEILKKADSENAAEFLDVAKGHFILLSVGRLEWQKGYDLTIKICKKLKDEGFKFKWFILGEGSERKKIEKEIKRFKLENTLYLLGVRKNPYPYFKNCDIYVQTSRHEGYVTTVTEAKIFSKPVVCTDVAGAREQIIDGKTGYITKFDAREIAEKIQNLMCDRRLIKEFSLNSSKLSSKKENSLNMF